MNPYDEIDAPRSAHTFDGDGLGVFVSVAALLAFVGAVTAFLWVVEAVLPLGAPTVVLVVVAVLALLAAVQLIGEWLSARRRNR